MHDDLASFEQRQHARQFPLNGALAPLNLPSVEVSAVILDCQLVVHTVPFSIFHSSSADSLIVAWFFASRLENDKWRISSWKCNGGIETINQSTAAIATALKPLCDQDKGL